MPQVVEPKALRQSGLDTDSAHGAVNGPGCSHSPTAVGDDRRARPALDRSGEFEGKLGGDRYRLP
jgi:hypothetical protein